MSKRRFLPTDAFVDESIRGQRYLMGCVLVEAKWLPDVRRAVVELALDGNRIHFHNESKRRRQLILGAFVELPLKVDIVVCQRSHGVSEFDARNACLKSIVERLQADEVPRLMLESRDDDSDDVRTISRVRSASPSLVFEHRSVRPLVLRNELPPDDTVVVVRGGEMKSEFVRSSAQDAFFDFGVFTVSVALALDSSLEELCTADRRIARYGKVRLSTVGRLHELGFALLPTLDRPHYDVVLPDLEDATLDRLELAFDLPILRPGTGEKS